MRALYCRFICAWLSVLGDFFHDLLKNVCYSFDMKSVRIYSQSKSQTQSGRGKANVWIIEPELQSPRTPEALMGWTSAGDALSSQLQLKFSSRDAAEQFAKSNGWRYTVSKGHARQVVPRNYALNHVYDSDVEK